jgi:subtilisin
MSLEGPLPDDQHCGWKVHDPLHVAICRSVAAGVTYTVSAGNGGSPFTAVAPANYDQVLTVTAMADFDGRPGGLAEPDCYGQDYVPFRDDAAALFSNYAVEPLDVRHTIAAPGVCVTSTVPGGYTSSDGTSFASPIVAGTAAMCVASGPCAGLSPRPLMAKVIRIMEDYNQQHRGYGYRGDPIRPIQERYYGYLVNQSMF